MSYRFYLLVIVARSYLFLSKSEMKIYSFAGETSLINFCKLNCIGGNWVTAGKHLQFSCSGNKIYLFLFCFLRLWCLVFIQHELAGVRNWEVLYFLYANSHCTIVLDETNASSYRLSLTAIIDVQDSHGSIVLEAETVYGLCSLRGLLGFSSFLHTRTTG